VIGQPRISTRWQAGQAAALLERTAQALETSAALAEDHAHRREREGKLDAAKQEHAAARQASEAAGRARARAEELLEFRRWR
jgi:hypothetical protein